MLLIKNDSGLEIHYLTKFSRFWTERKFKLRAPFPGRELHRIYLRLGEIVGTVGGSSSTGSSSSTDQTDTCVIWSNNVFLGHS